MPISGNGWEIHVERLGLHVSGLHKRTYSAYQVYIDGNPVDGLAGHFCECIGPGDKVAKSGNRILEGVYPMRTQFGIYRTIGYSNDTHVAGKPHMPGLCLGGTKPRTGILIHPGHPPDLYLSSIGCLNPTKPLAPGDMMDFWDSRSRAIALIDSLRAFAPTAFKTKAGTAIANAWAVIDGETMKVLHAPAPPAATEGVPQA
jgi:hypothetical protein